jgi:hypothetical protein
MRHISLYAYLLCAALILGSALLYYPKWAQDGNEATLGWDVSGYYLYLPAAIIYKDMKGLAFFEGMDAKYRFGEGMAKIT